MIGFTRRLKLIVLFPAAQRMAAAAALEAAGHSVGALAAFTGDTNQGPRRHMAHREYVVPDLSRIDGTGNQPLHGVNRERVRPSGWVIALATVILAVGCGGEGAFTFPASGHYFEAQVIDAATNRPIANASLIAKYVGGNGAWGHSESVCRCVEYTTSSDSGVFRFRLDGGNEPMVEAYKYGYRSVGSPRQVQKRTEIFEGRERVRYYVVKVHTFDMATGWAMDEGFYATREEAERAGRVRDLYMEVVSGTRAERFDALASYILSSGCINGRDSQKNEIPFLRAVQTEMRDLTETPKQAELVKHMDKIIEMTATAH